MSQNKREALTTAERNLLTQLADSIGEVAVATACDAARLTVNRGRLGEPLNSRTRRKIREYLTNAA